MLKIFNDLKPFFEDVYRDISVREYSRIVGISPPTASVLLNEFSKEGILIRKKNKVYLNFRANRQSFLFIDLSKVFWKQILRQELGKLQNTFLYREIVLFGSLAKCENNSESDIDLFVDIPKKNIDLSLIEKKLKRNIQIHFSDAKKNNLLLENIQQGVRVI